MPRSRQASKRAGVCCQRSREVRDISKATILIVDDAPDNILVLDEILRETYRVQAATSGERALALIENGEIPDLVLLDVLMPEMDGFEVCRHLRENPRTHRIPILFVTSAGDVEDEERGFEAGGVDYIHKPVTPALVRARVRTHLALYDQNKALEDMVRLRTAELADTRLEIIRRLGRAAEFKDNETGMHVLRISLYCRALAEALGWEESRLDLVFNASPMHDVGKIGIPDNILLKPGRLNSAEWALMRQHPEMGASIIGNHSSQLMTMARDIALSHHERWDGTGYPFGLRGEQIPAAARIVAVADVFDALTSVRPYKGAWTDEVAIEHVRQQSGKHFEPSVVEAFNSVLDRILRTKIEYSEEVASKVAA